MSATSSDRSQQMGRTMLGLADLLELAALKLREFGTELITQAKGTKEKARHDKQR